MYYVQTTKSRIYLLKVDYHRESVVVTIITFLNLLETTVTFKDLIEKI